MNSARDPSCAGLGGSDINGECLEIGWFDAAVVTDKVAQRAGRCIEPEVAEQLPVGLDRPIRSDQHRASRHQLQQSRVCLSSLENLLRKPEPARGDDGDRRGDRQPKKGERNNGADVRGTHRAHSCEPPRRIAATIGTEASETKGRTSAKEKGPELPLRPPILSLTVALELGLEAGVIEATDAVIDAAAAGDTGKRVRGLGV